MSSIKINWKELLSQLWAAAKPALLGALAGGVVAFSGCNSLQPSTRGQTTEIVAVGVPAVAWISHTTQTEENAGGDTNATVVSNSVTGTIPISASVPIGK